MDFLELVKQRESCRSYAPTAVEHQKLMTCIEAARLAPSACNSQPWRFILVDDPALLPKVGAYMQSAGLNKFARQAPAFVLILPDKGNLTARVGGAVTGRDFTSIDLGIATAHLCLAATQQGLGSCIMGAFQENPLKELLGIPKAQRIELVVALGYPMADAPRPKKRKPVEKICSHNRF